MSKIELKITEKERKEAEENGLEVKIDQEASIFSDSRDRKYKSWSKNGNLHRENGPALEYDNGTSKWYFNGKLHRACGPAVLRANGNEEWYINGRLSRLDGPAIIKQEGSGNLYKAYYLEGEKHRLDGPAETSHDGSVTWYKYGKIHRDDGPAAYRINSGYNYYYYYYQDVKLTYKKWLKRINKDMKQKHEGCRIIKMTEDQVTDLLNERKLRVSMIKEAEK